MEAVNYVDSGKRGRIIILSFGITLSLFVLRALEMVDPSNFWNLAVMSVSYFFISYIGLIWAFRFNVNRRSLLLILPQSSFFTMSQMLFVMLFFFRNFERVYELFLLFFLILVIFVATYVSFLMANIFNVAAFRQIPLVQVAKTTSYILTILAVYFSTFAVLAMQLSIPITIGLILFSYMLILLFHINHFNSPIRQKTRAVGLILVSMLNMFVTTMFWSTRYELLALIPVSVAFVMLSLEMSETKKHEPLKWYVLLQYCFIVFFALGINIFLQ